MVKKRRDFTDVNVVGLSPSSGSIYNEIAERTDVISNIEIKISSYRIRDLYGRGSISEIKIEDVTITTLLFNLKKDIVLKQKLNDDFVQLSFLIEGEKVISLAGYEDIFFESGDSYMAKIKSFNGNSKIAGNRDYKEIKVKLSDSFLSKHGFTNDLKLKELIDDNLVLPITNEVLIILETIEQLNFIGTARIIYLKAKVFELLAIQVSNYKKGIYKPKAHYGTNTFKKLFSLKKRIDENLNINFSVEMLSKEMGINKTNLNREFLRVFGLTIYEYSIEQKIKKAKLLLLNTDVPIYQIAEEIGYKNATHFSAAFKRQEGMTPKQFKVGK